MAKTAMEGALVHYRTERLREIAAKDRRELKRIVTVSHAARVEAGVEKPATKKQPKIKRETAKADRRATKATKHDTQTAKKLARASKKCSNMRTKKENSITRMRSSHNLRKRKIPRKSKRKRMTLSRRRRETDYR